MKNGIKTLAIWLVLGIIFIGLLNAIFNNPETKMSYSDLISKISAGEVTEIEISSDKQMAYVTLKGSETSSKSSQKEVAIPSVDSFMEQISDNLVSGQLVLISTNHHTEQICLTISYSLHLFLVLLL